MDIVAPLIHDIILEMIDGRGAPPTDFNFAYLICLPKGSGELVDGGLRCYDASSTRPLSIVDSINRIIASVFRLVLERQVHTWISYQQRGFVCGRQMLLNIIDVDFAAQKISIKSARGAILLLDFRAAFPSMCHSFIWDTLESIGLPRQFIKALQLFYVEDKHWIRIGANLVESVTVHSGVRQGCPLSPIIFALCADVLLRVIQTLLHGDEIARAFADDTAIVLSDYLVTLPALCKTFQEYSRISALTLNISKTVFIPLWGTECLQNVRNLLRECCPPWRDIMIDTCGKYFGFFGRAR